MLPESDDALLAILVKHLPPASRHWSITLVGMSDGRGDGMLPLPPQLLTQMGWKEGDALSAVMKEPGA
jgi:hypothetical protein